MTMMMLWNVDVVRAPKEKSHPKTACLCGYHLYWVSGKVTTTILYFSSVFIRYFHHCFSSVSYCDMLALLRLHEIFVQVPVPLPAIFFFIFAAPWLTGQIVAMECAAGQKERRSRNSVTSWRGLTLFLPPLTVFVHPTSASPSSYLILRLSPFEAWFYLCSLTLFPLSGCWVLMQAQVLLLGLSCLYIYKYP